MANITGWGRGTWSEGAWSEGLPVELTGIQSNTSVGTAQSGVGPDVAVTGNLISSNIGTVTVIEGTGVDAPVTTVLANTAVGTVSLSTDQLVQL